MTADLDVRLDAAYGFEIGGQAEPFDIICDEPTSLGILRSVGQTAANRLLELGHNTVGLSPIETGGNFVCDEIIAELVSKGIRVIVEPVRVSTRDGLILRDEALISRWFGNDNRTLPRLFTDELIDIGLSAEAVVTKAYQEDDVPLVLFAAPFAKKDVETVPIPVRDERDLIIGAYVENRYLGGWGLDVGPRAWPAIGPDDGPDLHGRELRCLVAARNIV